MERQKSIRREGEIERREERGTDREKEGERHKSIEREGEIER